MNEHGGVAVEGGERASASESERSEATHARSQVGETREKMRQSRGRGISPRDSPYN